MNPFNVLKPQYVFRPAQILRRLQNRRTQPTNGLTTAVLPWGLSLQGSTTDVMFRTVFEQGVLDLEVTEAIFRLLQPGDLFLDIGANLGFMTNAASYCLSNKGRIMAFEPHPVVFAKLMKNVETIRGRYPGLRVEPHQLALSDQSGEVVLHEPADFSKNEGRARLSTEGLAGKTRTLRIEAKRLDELVKPGEKVQLAKLDVERHEAAVLRGSDALLQNRAIQNIVFEDHYTFPSPVHEVLQTRGYSLFELHCELFGPRLKTPQQGGGGPNTNYLATLKPDGAGAAFEKRGWLSLAAPARS